MSAETSLGLGEVKLGIAPDKSPYMLTNPHHLEGWGRFIHGVGDVVVGTLEIVSDAFGPKVDDLRNRRDVMTS